MHIFKKRHRRVAFNPCGRQTWRSAEEAHSNEHARHEARHSRGNQTRKRSRRLSGCDHESNHSCHVLERTAQNSPRLVVVEPLCTMCKCFTMRQLSSSSPSDRILRQFRHDRRCHNTEIGANEPRWLVLVCNNRITFRREKRGRGSCLASCVFIYCG